MRGAGGVVLGVLLPADASFDSICNGGGDPAFGPNSVFNDASPYGGPFGANSPFNIESTAPPGIYVDGALVAHLSVSAFVTDPVDPYAVLEWLGCPVS